MATTLVRVEESVHARLRDLSEKTSKSIGQVIADLVDSQDTDTFWKEMRAGYDRLHADPVAWKAYQDEVTLLEGGSMDGLENEPPYFTPEEEEEIRAEFARTQSG